MTDTIYSDLKQQGLILSQGTQIGFPPIRAPKPGFLGQLASYLVPQTKFEQCQYKLIIEPILSNCFVIGRCNTLMCYNYQIDNETMRTEISKPDIINLAYIIQKIHICDSKYLSDRGQIPFIVQSKHLITLFYVNLKECKIIQRNSIQYTNTHSLRFICEKQLVIMTQRKQIHHVLIQAGKIKLKTSILADLKIQPNEEIAQINILGNIDEEQVSTICLFYYLKLKNQSNSQILRVKEYQRDLDGKLLAQKDFVIVNAHNSVVLTQNYQIFAFDTYYCILIKHEILILKKKFDRYLFIDNVMQKIGGNTLKLHQKGIVTSHSENSMQVNIILFNDPKCNSKLLDNIEIDASISENFLMTWPFKNEKDTSLLFVFQKQKKLVFFNLIKMDPNQKMLMVVQNTPKDKITVIQQIAVNLGINKKDFYLNQWAHSKRELSDIYQFLLPCWDIQSIKKQLRMTMRRKKIEVSQLLKIFERLGKIIKNQLQTNLSQYNLVQYLKNDFLYRKIKLKTAQKKIDHRELDKIYNSSLIDMFVEIAKNDLYPCQKQLDPLHAMVQVLEQQKIDLKHVFQDFRITILQNYKKFLINFISCFSPDQIISVIDKYHFLLPVYKYKPQLIIHQPDYMTQVQLLQMISKTQTQQQPSFKDMTSIEFARELSKERIQKELHDFYPNSKINEAIQTLVNSQYGNKLKLHKHGLISCSMKQYRDKLKHIQDIKLFLKVCQHVNQYNLDSNNPDDDLSVKIVQIFKQKNKLTGKAYQTVRLYTSMHRFMLKNNFCQKKIMTAQQLMQLSNQDLVALFFLQNRQRKQFIFKQFRDLFVNLYNSTIQFNLVIDNFITSQNCSRIQLEIFINQIKQKGEQFQIHNQQLIQLIVNGFCNKLELREDSDTCRFLEIIQEVQLNKKLAIMVTKIIKVQACLHMFDVFNCEKMSYFDILKYQQDNQIFKILLQKYFDMQLKRDVVNIEDQQVCLDFPRNMLTVLLYLKEHVYYEITFEELMLTYCEILIQWKHFQVIKKLIYQQQVLSKLQMQVNPFMTRLIQSTLQQIYLNEQILYDPQTKQHIRQILQLFEGQNQIKLREFAKLQLVDIFQTWGITIHTNNIHLVVMEWNEGFRIDFVEDLIQEYIHKLDFQTFQSIYRCLEITAGTLQQDVNIFNEEFVSFSLYYAEQLLQQKKYDQIAKILSFVKQMEQAQVSYSLISQTFLQCLLQKYPESQQIVVVKQAIQYFTQNFNDGQKIQQVFATNLQQVRFKYITIERESSIKVKETFCFRKQTVSVDLNVLWELAQSIYHQKSDNLEILYYSYYFLIMAFRDPEHGFTKNHKISYSLEVLTDLLFKIQNKVDLNNQLWAINTYTLFKKFKKGLYLQAITRIKQINTEQFKASKNDDTQVEMIKNRLKDDKQRNSQLLKCLCRVETYLSAYKSVRKTQRQIRFEKSKIIKDQQIVEEVVETIPEPQQNTNNVTINLRKFMQRKTEISNASAFIICDKDILEQIYQQENQQKQEKRRKNRNNKGGLNNFFLPIITNAVKQSQFVQVERKMMNQQYQQLKNTSRDELMSAAASLYNCEQKDFHQMVTLLDELSLTDSKKMEVGRLCKIYLNQSCIPSSSQLKQMFPFSFFSEPSPCTQIQFKQHTYQFIHQYIPFIIQEKDNEYLRILANYIGNVMSDNTYIGRFYVDVVIFMGNAQFNAKTVVRLRVIMTILRDYAQELRDYLTNVIQAYKDNHDLKQIIKHELLTCFQDYNSQEVQNYIRQC